MSRRPSLIRRSAVAYMQFINSATDSIIGALGGAKAAPPGPAPSVASATAAAPARGGPARLPVCFTQTRKANTGSVLRSVWHWLGYDRQPSERRVFWVDDADSADSLSAWRVLDDRPFGGTSEAHVRIEDRTDEAGAAFRVLVFEGHLRALPPFAAPGSRWIEDRIRPPDSSSAAAASPSPPSAGPTGEVTPPGMLDGFASLTSPNYAWPDLNLHPYSQLSFTMTTDGRPYILSIRCKERLPLVYQARVPGHPFEAKRPLHTKSVPFRALLTTFQGRMRTLQLPVPTSRVASWGLGVNGPPGPFRVEVREAWARKGMTPWEAQQLSPEERLHRARDDQREDDGRFLWWLEDDEHKRDEPAAKPTDRGTTETRISTPRTAGDDDHVMQRLREREVSDASSEASRATDETKRP